MAGSGDDLSRSPAVLLHDADRIAGVLDGVGSVGLEDEVGGGDTLGLGDAGHDAGFGKSMFCMAGEDEARGDAPLVLANALGDAGEHGRRRIAVAVDAGAEDDDGVEAVCSGVAGGCVGAGKCGPDETCESGGGCGQYEACSQGNVAARGAADVSGGGSAAG